MNNVSPRYMSMVRRLLVKSGLVMFGRFPVVTSGVCKISDAFLWCSAAFFDISFSPYHSR